MAVSQFVKALLGVELFQGLRPLQISEIARRADRIVYKPGAIIVERDAAGDAAVLIIDGEAGRISVANDDYAMSAPLPPGTLIGEMAMLIETTYASTVVARTMVRALRLNRTELLAQMAEDNAFADHLVQRIASRLTSIAAELRSIDGGLARGRDAFRDPSADVPAAQTPAPGLMSLSSLSPANRPAMPLH